MKVYVIMAFDAEPYSTGSWVHGVYASKAKAKAAVGPRYAIYDEEYDEETGNRWGGYMISNLIHEMVVQ